MYGRTGHSKSNACLFKKNQVFIHFSTKYIGFVINIYRRYLQHYNYFFLKSSDHSINFQVPAFVTTVVVLDKYEYEYYI